MKKLLISIFFACIFTSLLSYAQTTKEEFLSDPRYVGGLYCPYITPQTTATPAPAGYEPFYISHYGRHGSRWVLSEDCHTVPIKILGEALSAGKLTDLGKSVLERIKLASDDAQGRYGDLSPLGASEERMIAERMLKAFPQVFTTDPHKHKTIYSRSTQVPRCIMTMAAFHERIKETYPDIEIISEASKRNGYLNTDGPINHDTVKATVSAFMKRNFRAERFISSLFTDTNYAFQKIKDRNNFAQLIFSAAINLLNLKQLNFTLLDVFTDNEKFILWQASNIHMYGLTGPSAMNGAITLASAKPLLRDIVNCADKAIVQNSVAADLRFGHDSYIIPLVALMDIENMNTCELVAEKIYSAWSSFKISPMGTNVQLIFYKNTSNNDVIVKLLHCEKEVHIPVTTDMPPYYHWKDVKAFFESKLIAR